MFSLSTRHASFLAVAACLLVLLLPACMSSEAAPSSLAIVGEMEFEQPVCCSASVSTDDGEYLYAMTLGGEDESAQLHILEVGDDGSPEEIGSLQAPVNEIPFGGMEWWKVSPAVSNGHLYVPLFQRGGGGIWVLDISDPATPEEVNFVRAEFADTVIPPSSMSISGDTAAVAPHAFGTIFLFDVSNPDEPRMFKTFNQGGASIPEVELVDDTLYISSISGIDILDVADAEDLPEGVGPQHLGTVDPTTLGTDAPETLMPSEETSVVITPMDERDTDQISDVAVADNEYLYGLAGTAGLSVVDISEPGAPERIASMEFELSAKEVAIDGDWLYVLTIGEPVVGESMSDIPREIHVIDISDPTEPETIQTIEDVPGGVPPWRDVISGDEYLYVFDYSSVHVLGDSE